MHDEVSTTTGTNGFTKLLDLSVIVVEEENNKNILDITDKRTPDEVNTVPRRNRNGPAREK